MTVDDSTPAPEFGAWREIPSGYPSDPDWDGPPHGVDVLLAVPSFPTGYTCEVRPYSTGWPRNEQGIISNMSYHGYATHWMPLPDTSGLPSY